MPKGKSATCFCGTCQKCKRRVCTQKWRARKRAMLRPWDKSIRKFTLEHLGFGQSSLSEVAADAKKLLAHSRQLRMQVYQILPPEGKVC